MSILNQSSKYVVASKPVIYSEKLSEAYAADRKRREEALEREAAAAKAELKVKEKESLSSVLIEATKFSTAAAKAVTTFQKAKATADAKKKAGEEALAQREYATTFGNPERTKVAQLHWEIKEGKATAQKELDEKLDEIYNLAYGIDDNGDRIVLDARYVDLHHELKNSKGIEIIRDRKMAARAMLPTLTRDSFITSMSPEELRNYNNDPTNQNVRYEQWRSEQIAFLELDPELEAVLFSEEFKRQSETGKGINDLNTINRVATAAQRVKADRLITASKSGIEGFQQELTTQRDAYLKELTDITFPDGTKLSAEKQANQLIKADLLALSKDADLGLTLVSSYLKWGFPSKSKADGVGTPETVFFTKQDVQDIVEAAELGDKRKVRIAASEDLRQVELVRRLKLSGNLDDDSKGDEILKGLRDRGLVPKTVIENLDGIDVADQTEEAYIREEKAGNWEQIELNGSIVQEEEAIKQIKNEKLRERLEGVVAHIKTRRTQTGYPRDDFQFVRDRLKAAYKLTLGDDETLPGKMHDLHVSLVQKLRKDFQSQVIDPQGNFITDPNSWRLANDNFESYIVANGVDVVSGGGLFGQEQPGEGIFSANSRGQLKNFRTFLADNLKAVKEHESSKNLLENKDLTDKYDANIKQAFKDAEVNSDKQDTSLPLIERVLAEPEAILTKEDILGFFAKGTLSQEIVYKAYKMGIPPSTLIRAQLQALQNDDRYKEYLELHQLSKETTQYRWPYETSPDEKVYEMLEIPNDTGAGDLRYAWGRGGTTPNQNKRIRNILIRRLQEQEAEPLTDDQKPPE